MSKLSFENGKMIVPSCVTVPYITGDGVGAEITPVCQAVVDAAVKKAYAVPLNGKKSWPGNVRLT